MLKKNKTILMTIVFDVIIVIFFIFNVFAGHKCEIDDNGNIVVMNYYNNRIKRKNCWVKLRFERAYVYVEDNGIVLTNKWQDGYYLNEHGRISYNKWINYNDVWYYCGKNGKAIKNQVLEQDNGIFFFDEDGKMLTDIDDFEYNGKKYKIMKDGKMIKK